MADVSISGLQSATASVRNPDLLDRTHGTATGGVSSDRIGFSREPTPDQRVARLRQAADPLAGRETTYSGSRNPPPADADTSYGPDGKLRVSNASSYGAVAVNPSAERAPARLPETGAGTLSVPSGNVPATQEPSPQEFRLAATSGVLETKGRSDVADQRALESSQAAAQTRSQREGRQEEQVQRSEAVVAQAQRNGEAQHVEPAAPAATSDAITRQRLANAYLTVPRDVTSRISLFA